MEPVLEFKLDEFKQQTKERFDFLDEGLDKINKRLDKIDKKLEESDGVVQNINNSFIRAITMVHESGGCYGDCHQTKTIAHCQQP